MPDIITLAEPSATYAPMVTLAQIVEGDHVCDYCDLAATLGIATGADPDITPCCYQHAMGFLSVSIDLAASLSGVTTDTVT